MRYLSLAGLNVALLQLPDLAPVLSLSDPLQQRSVRQQQQLLRRRQLLRQQLQRHLAQLWRLQRRDAVGAECGLWSGV